MTMPAVQDPPCSPIESSHVLAGTNAFKRGDFSVRLPQDWTGLSGKVADAFNEVIELNERMAKELDRLSRAVGKEGRIAQRASLGDVTGSWADTIHSVNELVGDLVHPTNQP